MKRKYINIIVIPILFLFYLSTARDMFHRGVVYSEDLGSEQQENTSDVSIIYEDIYEQDDDLLQDAPDDTLAAEDIADIDDVEEEASLEDSGTDPETTPPSLQRQEKPLDNENESDTDIGDTIVEEIVPLDDTQTTQQEEQNDDPVQKKEIATIYERDHNGQEHTHITEKIRTLETTTLTAIIPENTQITTKNGRLQDVGSLVLRKKNAGSSQKETPGSSRGFINRPHEASSITQQETDQETSPVTQDEKLPSQIMFEFGLPEEHLIFSQPIRLEVAVPYPDASRIDILVEHVGDTAPSTEGLSTDPTSICTDTGESTGEVNRLQVRNGKIQFYTCGASLFYVNYVGGPTIDDFVDNESKDKIITVTTSNIPAGYTIQDINVIVDFHSIDGLDPANPGPALSYANEISFSLTSPNNTTVNLLNANTYTNPAAPRVTVTFDDSAASAPSGVPTTGTFLPAQALSAFNGQLPHGNWTFTFADNTFDDGLILFEVTLEIDADQLCGNGILDSGEQCDDGNTTNSDGCNNLCEIETGRQCSGQPSICTPTPPPGGLLLHYDGSFAGGLFTDISGNGNDGTPFNSVTTTNQNGETVMCFNGSNQYIERVGNLVTSFPFTMSTWVKTDTTAINGGIMSFARANANNRMYNIEHNTTTMRALSRNTQARYANAVTNMNTSEWFLITAVYNANNNREIYINGILDGTNTQGSSYDNNTNKRLHIGRFAGSTASNYFDGCVGDVRFYDNALNASQIYSLYAQPATLSTTSTNQASPLLTGTIQGINDRITITIDGNTYTGTNTGNGTWSLPANEITPTLTNTVYPVTLTVINPYDRAVTYNANLTVTLSLNCGNGILDSGEQCDDGNTTDGDGCSSSCQIESGYECTGEPSVCAIPPLTCGAFLYIDDDASGRYSTGDVLLTGGEGMNVRTGHFDITTNNPSIVIDFDRYDDGTFVDINGTRLYAEQQPDFFSPALNAPRTVNSNGLPRLRITLMSGNILLEGTLTATATTLTTLTPTNGITQPTFIANAQNELVLGVTNAAGASGSNFTITYEGNCITPVGDYCLVGPETITFPIITTESYAQTGITSSSGYFQIIDSSGDDNGYYTTLQISDLSGSTYQIPNSDIARQSLSGVDLISGTPNSNVVLGSAFSSWSIATGTATFLFRDTGPNSSILGTYGANIDLRLSLPAFMPAGTYLGEITYTLYEN